MNLLMKIHNNKIYSSEKACFFLSDLRVKNIEISKNEILKSKGNAMCLINVNS
jgi:hypothetical protein